VTLAENKSDLFFATPVVLDSHLLSADCGHRRDANDRKWPIAASRGGNILID
jgi:hypothetical protein